MNTYTEAQATDEAVLLLTRKLRRLYPDVYTNLMSKLPQGARTALDAANLRADIQRGTDDREGIRQAREYPDPYADDTLT